MVSARSDRDLLVEMRTDLKYIVKSIDDHAADIKTLKTENQTRKDWQESADTRIKTYMGVATFVGGLIFFIVENAWRWLERVR